MVLGKFFGIGDKDDAEKEEKQQLVEEVLEKEPATASLGKAVKLAISMIVPNPFQPRKIFSDAALQELADSIREVGILQPLLIRKSDAGCELIAGERRLRAAKLAGLSEVPVIYRNFTDKEMAESAMIENLQRENLHFLEEALGFMQLLEAFDFTQAALAKRMGISQSTLANKLRLLRLSSDVQNVLMESSLTERHARALLRLPMASQQLSVVKEIIQKELNVKQTEALIDSLLAENSDIKKKRKMTGIVRDVRIYINTIKQVTDQMKLSGLKIKVQQEQSEDYITLNIKIPKKAVKKD